MLDNRGTSSSVVIVVAMAGAFVVTGESEEIWCQEMDILCGSGNSSPLDAIGEWWWFNMRDAQSIFEAALPPFSICEEPSCVRNTQYILRTDNI